MQTVYVWNQLFPGCSWNNLPGEFLNGILRSTRGQTGIKSLRCYQCRFVIFFCLPSFYSDPLASLLSWSPDTGDHSVTDRPWGVRSAFYSSFGVNASCLLQFPFRCCACCTLPAFIPTQVMHIYYAFLHKGYMVAEKKIIVSPGFEPLYLGLAHRNMHKLQIKCIGKIITSVCL